MTRARNIPASRRRRKKVLKRAKGFRGARRNHIRLTQEMTDKAMAFAYRGRKERKRDFRGLWIVRISAATKACGTSYSKFMDGLKKLNITLNRKVLADLAVSEQSVFEKLVAIANQ
ncbi:MAG: 50S ribosomal protein L20 [Candidatus Auribacterota bacterium]|jgi:large subunit ribosomal protein L20|uniref:Large ribosomal subunit protein bL20 n=1 Tax=Candidatus Auribacter fodinae TaxID=2093366 RepID=A0A3A4RFE5_9BACT|nr:MAG: 50S ribosomal protein L20 [Candidatus Auribacter fodinae]